MLEKEFEDIQTWLEVGSCKESRSQRTIKSPVEADEVRAKAKDLIICSIWWTGFCLQQISDKLDGIADNYLQNENGQNFMKLYNQLRAEKILKLIREKITVQEKKVTVDEFKKIVEEHKH